MDAELAGGAGEVLAGVLGILHRRNHQLEAVRIRSPAVGHVLQSHKVRARQERVDGVLCVPTGDVNLGRGNGMGSIVDQQVIVAVELQHVEAEHEALQHRVRLEGDDAVQIPLILRPEHCSIDLPIKLLQEVVLAQRLHVVVFTLLGGHLAAWCLGENGEESEED